jgi:formate hydrogenlyase transcriptional activator
MILKLTVRRMEELSSIPNTLEWLPDAVLILGGEGQILLVNAAAERLFGYARRELMGRPAEVCLPAKLGERCREILVQAASLNPWPIETLELEAGRKDGTRFPIEASLSPFRAGQEARLVVTVRDISRRKQAEQALRQTEARFSMLVEEVKDYAIFMLDPEGRITSWNKGAERMRGYSANEVMGRHFSMFFLPEDIEAGKPEEELRTAAAEGRIETEGWRLRKDGSRFWASIVLTALRDDQGKLLGFVKIGRDITERKRIGEALLLETANQLISQRSTAELLTAIAASLRKVKDYDYAAIALYDPLIRKLRVRTLPPRAGTEPIHEERLLPVENSPAGWAFKARRPLILDRIRAEGKPMEMSETLVHQGVQSACRIPLMAHDRVLGTLTLASRRENDFTNEDIASLTQLAGQIAIALDNAMAFRQLMEMRDRLAEEKDYLEDEIRDKFNFGDIVGESTVIKDVLSQVQTVAPTDSAILILGETGTGKELVARAIHRLSARHDKIFVTLNCSAIPASLFESELFGHEKGAFTGSASRQIGRFELAHQGTLFLDEVGDIPLELQSKLLRTLQEKQFERLGSTQTITVDVRIIAATNRNLRQMVEEGTFRSDLYYRLNVFPIFVPPLRERTNDIPLLARYFLDKYSKKLGKKIEVIPPRVLNMLKEYSWPGNVRELEHYIERAVILSRSSELEAPPLEADASKRKKGFSSQSLATTEREHILRILQETNWIVGGPRGAAARLGLKRTTLASKMRRLGISRETVEADSATATPSS